MMPLMTALPGNISLFFLVELFVVTLVPLNLSSTYISGKPRFQISLISAHLPLEWLVRAKNSTDNKIYHEKCQISSILNLLEFGKARKLVE